MSTRVVEFDLVTRIEPNARFASRAGMFAKSHRIKAQRAAVRAVLQAHLMPPLLHVIDAGTVRPNRIEVRLTRIAPGRTADAWENLRAALKAVKDEVAAWIGVDDREGGPVTWLDPGQEQGGQHVYRVRIEVTDLAPGADKRVVLAETASGGRAAKSRVKRAVNKAAKGATSVKTNGHREPLHHAMRRAETSLDRQLAGGAKPTVTDLKEAAERLGLRDGADGVTRRNGKLEKAGSGAREAAEAAFAKVTKPARPDPNVEALAAMREQARSVNCDVVSDAGTKCGAEKGDECRTIIGAAWEYGVHTARACAAGLPPYPSAAELNAGMRPVRVERECQACGCEGPRSCVICHGTGKVTAWEWQRAPRRPLPELSKADVDAYEGEMRACGMRRGRDYARVGNTLTTLEHAKRLRVKSDGDPGEERPARDLAPCTTCLAATGEPCTIQRGEPFIFGVHEARAKAAGIASFEQRRQKAPTTGVRKVVPAAGPPVLQAWVALPWLTCAVCEGPGYCPTDDGNSVSCVCSGTGHRLTRETRRDGADPHPTIRYRVPAEHVARFGPEVTLTRRPHTTADGPCWLYA